MNSRVSFGFLFIALALAGCFQSGEQRENLRTGPETRSRIIRESGNSQEQQPVPISPERAAKIAELEDEIRNADRLGLLDLEALAMVRKVLNSIANPAIDSLQFDQATRSIQSFIGWLVSSDGTLNRIATVLGTTVSAEILAKAKIAELNENINDLNASIDLKVTAEILAKAKIADLSGILNDLKAIIDLNSTGLPAVITLKESLQALVNHYLAKTRDLTEKLLDAQGLTFGGTAITSIAVGLSPPGDLPIGARTSVSVVATYGTGNGAKTREISSLVKITAAANPKIQVLNDGDHGKILGLALGITEVTVSIGALSQKISVNVVEKQLTSLAIELPASEIDSGNNFKIYPSGIVGTKLKAVGTYTDGSQADITSSVSWSSPNSAKMLVVDDPTASLGAAKGTVFAAGEILTATAIALAEVGGKLTAAKASFGFAAAKTVAIDFEDQSSFEYSSFCALMFPLMDGANGTLPKTSGDGFNGFLPSTNHKMGIVKFDAACRESIVVPTTLTFGVEKASGEVFTISNDLTIIATPEVPNQAPTITVQIGAGALGRYRIKANQGNLTATKELEVVPQEVKLLSLSGLDSIEDAGSIPNYCNIGIAEGPSKPSDDEGPFPLEPLFFSLFGIYTDCSDLSGNEAFEFTVRKVDTTSPLDPANFTIVDHRPESPGFEISFKIPGTFELSILMNQGDLTKRDEANDLVISTIITIETPGDNAIHRYLTGNELFSQYRALTGVTTSMTTGVGTDNERTIETALAELIARLPATVNLGDITPEAVAAKQNFAAAVCDTFVRTPALFQSTLPDIDLNQASSELNIKTTASKLTTYFLNGVENITPAKLAEFTGIVSTSLDLIRQETNPASTPGLVTAGCAMLLSSAALTIL